MSDEKRKRSPNWLPSEKELLLNLVETHLNVIENKKTDNVTIRAKLAQWKIIADQYNSHTTHSSRTGENLKAQWESMKKVARKDAANNRKHMIQTVIGGGSPIPTKKEDPFLQRILSLISTSASNDKDSIVPAVQDQGAIPAVQTEDFPEPSNKNYYDVSVPPTTIIVKEHISDTDDPLSDDEYQTKDWEDYTPQMLGTPVSLALRNNNEDTERNIKRQIHQPTDTELTPNNRIWVSRRPTHTSTSLVQLRKKKIETIELQNKLTMEEMERSKVRHDLDIKIKKQILLQEKIKTSLLFIKRRKLMALNNSKT